MATCSRVLALTLAAASAAAAGCAQPFDLPALDEDKVIDSPALAQDSPAKTRSSTFDQLAAESLAKIEGTLPIAGLEGEVRVLRDQWGVPHIFAQNTRDLFFAQGFVVAQDRLWQMELWRRTADGRVAELVGAAGVPHDRLVRLLKYRGPFGEAEWSSYHPEGKLIFAAYAAGVNAFIQSVGDNLPVEFKLTGVRPEPWTPEQRR